MDTVREILYGVGSFPTEKLPQLLEQQLRPGKLGAFFFFIEHGAVFVTYPADRVERAGVDNLA